MSKACTKCKALKPIDSFYQSKNNSCWCKDCYKEYRAINAKEVNERSKKSHAKKPEHYSALKKAWKQNNKHLNRAYSLDYLASKKNRKPDWFSELDDFIIKEAHHLAKERESMTGFKWHVDHIIPLNGKKVSGLHTYLNIQVIPASTNVQKHNKFEVA